MTDPKDVELDDDVDFDPDDLEADDSGDEE
jgi:hypothetical protein